MDDEGKIILKKIELDIIKRPRLALVNALSDWSRQWMMAYYGVASLVDPNQPAQMDQAVELKEQKEEHDSIMEEAIFANIEGLAALLQEAKAMGMPHVGPERPQPSEPQAPPDPAAAAATAEPAVRTGQ